MSVERYSLLTEAGWVDNVVNSAVNQGRIPPYHVLSCWRLGVLSCCWSVSGQGSSGAWQPCPRVLDIKGRVLPTKCPSPAWHMPTTPRGLHKMKVVAEPNGARSGVICSISVFRCALLTKSIHSAITSRQCSCAAGNGSWRGGSTCSERLPQGKRSRRSTARLGHGISMESHSGL